MTVLLHLPRLGLAYNYAQKKIVNLPYSYSNPIDVSLDIRILRFARVSLSFEPRLRVTTRSNKTWSLKPTGVPVYVQVRRSIKKSIQEYHASYKKNETILLFAGPIKKIVIFSPNQVFLVRTSGPTVRTLCSWKFSMRSSASFRRKKRKLVRSWVSTPYIT